MEIMPHLQIRDDLGVHYAILPGDPARVDRIAEQLTDVEELAYNREFKSIRGLYKGVPVLAVSSGIGGPSACIAVEELARAGVTHMSGSEAAAHCSRHTSGRSGDGAGSS